jgi:tetratricopeptide (TPR) repeat protein
MASRQGAPGPSFDVSFGYICKTLFQAFEAAGDREQADSYLGLAASAFSRVERQGARVSAETLAGALNGLGNVHSFRGESDAAVAAYRQAVALLPAYAYAWNDLFLELLNRANGGHFEPEAMDEALAGLRRTFVGVPGLDEEGVRSFERDLERLKAGSKGTG